MSKNVQEERFGFRAKGTFACASAITTPVVVAAIAVWALGIAFLVTDNPVIVAAFGSWFDPSISTGRVLATAAILVVWTTLMLGAAAIIRHGMDYWYEADDEAFAIYRMQNGRRKELIDTFYYRDVLEVSYSRAIFHNGFIVEIRTAYRTARYRPVFTKLMTDRTEEGTPFYILELRSGLRGEDGGAAGWAP